ncbi:MAG: phenylalanine--tRNA ligase subunit beta [Blastocatellia bacterium]|nr:phenylalanine--tRNA ligase subunit beta [Blastocatellia bacterium]MCX7752864.1 phenylalanine--tRNA ligase subunit beta [Blastocatellia bacterium]MDW8167920.1 phenylalanine--tRNA ligase subunit beta [Acidobacteriota bacterium]
MRVSYRWLKELVDFELSPRELAEKLTMVGLAVDRVEEVDGDALLELDVTSNRPDCLSHLGVAREIAVLCGTSARYPETHLEEDEEETARVTSVEIRDPDLCPRYVARVIRGVRVGPSPRWVVERLERLGQRSINNVADITNLVLLELGHPLHAFDLEKLVGRQIIVRRARAGERLVTLDGVKRTLRDDMLVIADAVRPVALAGIMGGEETGVSETTRDVLLESAYFHPLSIRRTARALGMSTEASYRFERGADYEAPRRAADRAARLIVEVAGGRILRGAIDIYPNPLSRTTVRLRRQRLRRILGVDVPWDEAVRLLRALGFHIERADGEEVWVIPPSFRVDIDGEDDLVEEVARHIGYDAIPTTLPQWRGYGELLPGEEKRRALRAILSAFGFSEAITFSFVPESWDALFREEEVRVCRLRNPIDETRAQLRTSLLPGLLESLLHNIHHGVRSVRLYEIGTCFIAMEDGQRPIEREQLGLVATGLFNERAWQDHHRPFGFYEMKGVVEALLEKLRVRRVAFERSPREYLHPGQSARLLVDGEPIGDFGQLHPRIAALFKFKQPVFVAELDLEKLLRKEGEAIRYRSLPRLPTVVRDFSLLVPREVAYAEIERGIAELGIPEIVEVRLFDVYTGPNVPADKRSLSISVRLRAEDRTLTEEEIAAIQARLLAHLRERFRIELRS